MTQYRVNAACVLFGRHQEIIAHGGETVELSTQDYERIVAEGQGHKLTPVVETPKPRRK